MGCLHSSDTQERYEGEYLKGKRHGHGKLTRATMDGELVYEGAFEHGVRSGQGRLKLGEYTFEGMWKDGQPFGRGTESHSRIGTLESNYFGSKVMDFAVFTSVGGIRYEGTFDNGICTQGTAVYPSGARYVGDFVLNPQIARAASLPFVLIPSTLNELAPGTAVARFNAARVAGGLVPMSDTFLREGQGVLTLPSGVVYKGQFRRGEPDGPDCTLRIPGGITLRGAFKRGRASGKGILANEKLGVWYEGSFVDNVPHGRGKLYCKIKLVPFNKDNNDGLPELTTVITYDGSWTDGTVSTAYTFTVCYPQPGASPTLAAPHKSGSPGLGKCDDDCSEVWANPPEPNFVPSYYVMYQGRLNELYQRHGAGKCWISETSVAATTSGEGSQQPPPHPIPAYRTFVPERASLTNENDETKSGASPVEFKRADDNSVGFPISNPFAAERRYATIGPALDRELCPLGGLGTGKILMYSGDWRYDIPKGAGAALFADGTLHIGSWAAGVPHGHGRQARSRLGSTVEGAGDASRGKVIIEGEWVHGVLTNVDPNETSSFNEGRAGSKLNAKQLAELAQDLEWEQRHSKLIDPCRYCGEREANCLFLECAHLMFCMECGECMSHCALCDRPVLQRAQVYK